MSMIFPQAQWQQSPAAELGFDAAKLADVGTWLSTLAGEQPYQVAVARYGHLAAEWRQGVAEGRQLAQASAAKSLYSSMLGIAVAEGVISSPDALAVDYYPEMMDVAELEGPKPERYAFKENRGITFRHLICNTSGYMKPGEEPGMVFNYQTYGMNILTHALAKVYGLYDVNNPEGSAGCGRLIEEKIRDAIGGSWSYSYTNFDLWDKAKLNIFGFYTQLHMTLRDQLRIGHLWLNYGSWDGKQVIPEGYLREAVVTNQFILNNEPEVNWKYGHGFWCNDHAKQWPDAPRDSFAASGAGAKLIWVCPRLGLVIAQNPGLWDQFKEGGRQAASQNEVIARIVQAINS